MLNFKIGINSEVNFSTKDQETDIYEVPAFMNLKHFSGLKVY